MKVRIALALTAALGLSSCGSLREARPLSKVDRDRGPLVLDGPDRVRAQRRQNDEPGLIARAMPWNWFD